MLRSQGKSQIHKTVIPVKPVQVRLAPPLSLHAFIEKNMLSSVVSLLCPAFSPAR